MRKLTITIIVFLALCYSAIGQVPELAWVQEIDGATQVEVDAEGNIYLGGSFSGVQDFDPSQSGTYILTSNGESDIFIAKYNPNMEIIWASKYGTSHSEEITDFGIDAAQNVYFADRYSIPDGNDPPPSQTGSQAFWPPSDTYYGFVVKLDSLGVFDWDVDLYFGSSYANNTPENINQIAVTPEGAVYTIGSTQGNMMRSCKIMKIENDSILWMSTHVNSGAGSSGDFIHIDPMGNIYYGGTIYTYASFPGTVDVDPSVAIYNLSAYVGSNYICKLNSYHNFQWATYLTEEFNTAFGMDITSDNDGNVYTIGIFSDTADFNLDTTLATAISSNGDNDIFVTKHDMMGGFEWVKSYGGIGADDATSIEYDSAGYLLAGGKFESTVDFDPGIGTNLLTSNGNSDIYLLKLGLNGNFIWAGAIGGPNDDTFSEIKDNQVESIILLGKYTDTIDVDPGPSNYYITNSGIPNNFLCKFSPEPPLNAMFYANTTSILMLDTIQFFDNCIGTPISWFWDFGDGMIDTVENPIHVYQDPGTYTVGLIVSDSIGSDSIIIVDYIEVIDPSVYPDYGSVSVFDGEGQSFAIDEIGNMYITGFFAGTVDFDPGPDSVLLTAQGDDDIFVSKINSNNELIWVKQIGGNSANSAARSTAIKLDPQGNIYLCGSFIDSVDFDPGIGVFIMQSNAYQDGFVCKLSNIGNFIWAIQFGSEWYNLVSDLVIDNSGNVYVTGFFSGTHDFDPDPINTNIMTSYSKIDYSPYFPPMTVTAREVFLAKYDISGNYIWATNLGNNYPINSAHGNESNAVTIDNNGDILIAGRIIESFQVVYPMYYDRYLFFSKFNNNGTLIWTKKMFASQYPECRDIICDEYDDIYLTGIFNSTVDFDPSSASYLVTSNGGPGDAFVSKYSSAGNIIWAKTLGGNGFDKGISIDLDTAGNVYTTGYFVEEGDFNPGIAVSSLQANSTELFISKLTSQGEYVWAQTIGGSGSSEGRCILLNENEDLFLMGKSFGNIDYNPGDGVYANQASGTFILKLKQSNITSQYIPLIDGWSIISTYIDPNINLLDSILSPVIDSLILVKDENGAVFWPQYSINAIDSLSIGKGYQVKMDEERTLTITGVQIDPQQTPIVIPQGWSMIGYLRENTGAIEQLLYPIVNEIVLVKNGDGAIYWPQYGLNTIMNMIPGKGYQINMNISDTLIYPSNTISMKANYSSLP